MKSNVVLFSSLRLSKRLQSWCVSWVCSCMPMIQMQYRLPITGTCSVSGPWPSARLNVKWCCGSIIIVSSVSREPAEVPMRGSDWKTCLVEGTCTPLRMGSRRICTAQTRKLLASVLSPVSCQACDEAQRATFPLSICLFIYPSAEEEQLCGCEGSDTVSEIEVSAAVFLFFPVFSALWKCPMVFSLAMFRPHIETCSQRPWVCLHL